MRVHLSGPGAIKLPNTLDYMFFGSGPSLVDVSIIPRNFIKIPKIRNTTTRWMISSGTSNSGKLDRLNDRFLIRARIRANLRRLKVFIVAPRLMKNVLV
jgi:hypothetical protein